MRKFPVNRLTLSSSMLAKVLAGDGTPVSGNGPWLDPNGGQSQTTGGTPPVSGAGPGLDPNGGH